MLINVELNQLIKELKELKTQEEKVNQINTWLENNNITESEHETLINYVTPQI